MSQLTESEGALALRAARNFAQAKIFNMDAPVPAFPKPFDEKRGVFVTITENGTLRGCIGFPFPVKPLRIALREAAEAAAADDPRFMPIDEYEIPNLHFEVTILTMPEILAGPAAERPARIEIGRHGLIAAKDGQSGLLLPQVAEEYGWNSEEFLSQTCWKAGLAEDAWKSEECIIQTFEGQIFSEEE
ncbi:MAG TPA: TIGR00296 family protein [Methanocorpusculum sp.]|nr:TIGR00296 family protein [Methanocorpusculum sp.]